MARNAHRGPKTRNRTDAERRDMTATAVDEEPRT
jgi:hypothetical protein